MAAGSYLLYQLLHCDAEQLPMVAHFMVSGTYLLEETTQTVTKYMDEFSIDGVLASLFLRGVDAYIIYDVAKGGRKPYQIIISSLWGMIVLSSPNLDNLSAWEKHRSPKRIVMN
ncbi:retrotransposon hot spot (RHS) protein [Trypanosoma cruzi]|nr:retrotransposon hot spot (RHS) protein [Trypanosoma cruzi]